MNVNARYRPDPRWEIFARINNLFDRKFYSGGIMAENPFNAAGVFQTNTNDWSRQTFFAPGAPFGAVDRRPFPAGAPTAPVNVRREHLVSRLP